MTVVGIVVHFIIMFDVTLQIINDNFGIVEGLMTTVHAITGKISSVAWIRSCKLLKLS
jgi:hypothetical protein